MLVDRLQIQQGSPRQERRGREKEGRGKRHGEEEGEEDDIAKTTKSMTRMKRMRQRRKRIAFDDDGEMYIAI